ncbi:MAG: deoxyribonuclease IV [Patescibacteria group bacterium]
MIKSLPKIGGHVSAAGGLVNAIKNAQRIGALCIQIFGASPRQWLAKMPLEADIATYQKALHESKIGPVFLHAAYLVNLGSPSPDQQKKAIQSLTEHLQIVEKIGAQGLIFHLGSYNGTTRELALEQTVMGMQQVLKNVPGVAQLVMENSAGGGQKLGYEAKEVGELFERVKSPRVKVCIDTAHAFEAGIIESYTAANIQKFVDEWDAAVGIKNVVALHVNDSKSGPSSHHDRHENLGEGYIGLSGFRHLAGEKRLHDKAWILEVPGFDENGPDARNIEILKSCFE